MPAQETVLVTGASSGIGLALAKLFAQDGCRLILAARSTDKLNLLAQELQQFQTECLVVSVDLAEPSGPQKLLQEIDAKGWQIDVLINNAGFAQHGHFPEISLERQLQMIQVNVSALTELAHRVLPGMRARKRGSILNIGSTASFQPGPNCAVYYATKSYVLSFSEALWWECRNQGITVSCLCPGPTLTGFGHDSGMEATPVFQLNHMRVEDVARAGHAAVRNRRRLVVPGWLNWLGAFSVRFTARPILLWLMDRLQPLTNRP